MMLGLKNEYGKLVPLHTKRQNFSIFGQSQVGKSELLTAYALNDIYSEKNVTVIGDSAVEEILKFIPRWRQNDVVYFNPAIQPFGFNPLFKVPRQEFYARAESIVQTIHTLLDYKISTPTMNEYIRLSIQTLLHISTISSSLLDAYYFLTDSHFRNERLQFLHDPTLKYHWNRFNNYTRKEQRDEVKSTLTKLSDFVFNPMLRDCFVQRANHLDFNNKIILLSLNDVDIGANSASFIGALVLATMQSQKSIRTNLYIDDASRFGDKIVGSVLRVPSIYTILTARSPHDFNNFNEIEKSSALVSFRVSAKDKRLLNDTFQLPPGYVQLNRQPPYRAYVLSGTSPIQLWFPLHGRRRPARNTRRGHKRVENSIIDRCWKMYSEPRKLIADRIKEFTAIKEAA